MKKWRSPLFLRVGLLVVVIGVTGALILARQSYLEKSLTTDSPNEATAEMRTLTEKTFGNMMVRVLPKDSFAIKPNPDPISMANVENWQLVNLEKHFFAQFCQMKLPPDSKFNDQEAMITATKDLLGPGIELHEISHRFYIHNGKLMLEGHYTIGLFERRIIACSQRKDSRALLLISIGPKYAWELQDSMMNSVRFN
jgi:hypothetical protein